MNDGFEIRVRRTQPETLITWIFDWLGTRWEAQAFEIAPDREPYVVGRTHAFSNTRRGAIRKSTKLLHNKYHELDWEKA